MKQPLGEVITELRMLLAEWLLLLASSVMTAKSAQTAIWREHLHAASEEIEEGHP